MKKILLTTALVAFSIITFTTTAFASATVSFTPASVSVVQGQTFTVKVNINPQNIKYGAVKMVLNYPADLLMEKSFSFGGNPNTRFSVPKSAESDLIDNTNGVLIKTAGYAGGVSSSATFGTVSFFAKKTGSGVIKVSDKTLILGATKNIFSGYSAVPFKINARVITPVYKPKPIVKKPIVKKQVATTSTTTATTTAVAISTTTPNTQPALQHKRSLLASIGNIMTFGLGNTFFGTILEIIVILLVLFGISYIAKKIAKKTKKTKDDSEE